MDPENKSQVVSDILLAQMNERWDDRDRLIDTLDDWDRRIFLANLRALVNRVTEVEGEALQREKTELLNLRAQQQTEE